MTATIETREVTSGDLRGHLADVLNRTAYAGERVVVTRHGKRIAAVIPADDLELLEALENARDAAALEQAITEDDGERTTVADLRKELFD
ncbi:MAG: type II toxin-antitoxin system prevent-host-death family antitoxin [Rhodococcus sp. (in: high G+C Gram-positive bacteria)]|uniref:type II toxin-antitoxin system Phd/YefM family antitoxin n=1 Tax=Rhodococcus sp. TaxID=1831 RepID=UPI003BAEEB74